MEIFTEERRPWEKLENYKLTDSSLEETDQRFLLSFTVNIMIPEYVRHFITGAHTVGVGAYVCVLESVPSLVLMCAC